MATIVTRSGKGSPLTHAEVDANFTNLNTDKLELSGGTMTGNMTFGDNNKAIFGAGSDLQIYHDGGHSYISDQGTGNLHIIASNETYIANAGNSEYKARFITDGAVELYYDAAKKFETTSTGVDISGDLNAVDNIVLATAMYHEGDTDTFLSFGSGGDSINLATGGSTRLSATNTGIDVTGTVTADLLNVTSGSSADNIVQVFGGGTIYAGLGVDGTGAILTAGSSGSADAALIIKTSASGTEAERLRISSSGHVGINYSDPASTGSRLVVQGDAGSNAVFIKGNTGSGTSWGLGVNAGSTSADASFRVYDKDGSNSYLYVRGDGNVGIGTGSPPNRLSVKQSGNTSAASFGVVSINSANDTYIGMGYDSSSDTNRISSSYSSSGAYKPIAFLTSDTERMRITSTGSVGIGTSSPDALLNLSFNESAAYSSTGEPREDVIIHNINGADGSGVNNHATLGFAAGGGATSRGYINYVRTADNTGAFTFSQRTGSSSYAEAMRIDQNGTLAVGTTDTHPWTVFDGRVRVGARGCLATTTASTQLIHNAYFDGSYKRIGGTDYATRYYQNDGTHVWDTAASGAADSAISFSEAMRISSSGNVGIGESSPLSKLHIEDTSGAVLTLGNSQSPNDVVTGTVFGRMNFYASDRSSTTNATGGVARIEAIAPVGYSGSTPSNLLFYTHGASANDGSVLGNPTEAMRIDSSGNLLVGTTSAEGVSSNSQKMIAGLFTTKNGVTTIANTGVATTLMTFGSNEGNFLVSALGSGTGSTNDNTTGIIHVNNSATTYTALAAGSGVVLSMSGLNLQVTQSIFNGANITWSVMKLR